jgi:hypothetical protein
MPDPHRGGCLCQYGSSFIGIAPASKPQLVVAVNIQDPRTPDYFGIAVAGPAFNDVMKFALQTLQIPPDGAKPPPIRLTGPATAAGGNHTGRARPVSWRHERR